MSKVMLGLFAGIVFGALDVGLMLPMSFPDKTTALLGAFTSRLAIGFVIGCVQLPGWPGWLVGLLFGLLINHAQVRSYSYPRRHRRSDYRWADSRVASQHLAIAA